MNKLLERHKNYEPLRGDPYLISMKILKNREKNKNNNQKVIFSNDYFISDNEAVEALSVLYSQLKYDLKPINKFIIMDLHQLSLKSAIEKFSSDFDIYCLGMPNETPENLLKTINQHDNRNDWTYYTGNTLMKVLCDNIINGSKENQEECKKHNIKFFDTSGNREEKIEEIITEIENLSIYDN